MLNAKRFLATALVCMTAAAAGRAAEEKWPSTLVFMPARLRIVALMQDVYKLRTITLVSYQGDVKKEPFMHKWDGAAWKQVTLDDFRADGAMAERIVIIGDSSTVPAAITDFSAQCENVQAVESLDATVVTSALEKSMQLVPSEVKWLAKRNKLEVVDRNADLRRYGRWGKPGTESKVKSPEEARTEAPAAPDVDQQLKKADDSAAKPATDGEIATETPAAPVVETDEPVRVSPKKSPAPAAPISPEDK